MAMAMPLDPSERIDYGKLANNYMTVLAVQTALSRSETNVQSVPDHIANLLAENAWREFYDTNRSVLVRNPADFRRFIEGPRPEGCQTPIHVLRHMVKGSPVEAAVEELLRGTPGNPDKIKPIRDPVTGRMNGCTGNRNNITVSGAPTEKPSIIPMPSPSAPEKPKRKRDYSRESKQGNSVGYTLRRLEREAPELLKKVKDGDMSPNAAAIRAGFRDKVITVPDDPEKAARVLLRHFQGKRLDDLIKALGSSKGRA